MGTKSVRAFPLFTLLTFPPRLGAILPLGPKVHVLARQPAEIGQRVARDQQRSWAGPPADQVRFACDWIALLAKANDGVSRKAEAVRRFLQRQPIFGIIDAFHKTMSVGFGFLAIPWRHLPFRGKVHYFSMRAILVEWVGHLLSILLL